MFVRSKIVKGQTYYQLVEGYRDEAGKVRHRTLASLGQSPTVAEALRVATLDAKMLKRILLRRYRLPPIAASGKVYCAY